MNCISRNLHHLLILLVMMSGLSAQSDSTPWWKNRPLRIYHPNMRELEAEDLDVDKFIQDCMAIHAEAIVFSVGGPFAFYNTKVPYHKKSPHMGNRDLLKEVIEKAKQSNIRVIARLDFSLANQDIFNERPEWFYINEKGIPVEKYSATEERFFRTRLLGGYRNEEYAFKVLDELNSGYEIDGVHLNSPGFQEKQFTRETMEKFNIPEEPEAQNKWRKEYVASHMKHYYQIIKSYNPNALFMAEINSPESPGWAEGGGFDHELLAESYTNLLSTAGEPKDHERHKMHWWSSLSADWSHAANSRDSGLPITNLKIGHKKGKLTLKPMGNYHLDCYQAFAHNAGIKAPSYGLMVNMPDPRTASMISKPFKFMERCEEYMTESKKIAPVGLIWPVKGFEESDAASLREEMLGIYRTLIKKHVLFEIILAHRMKEKLSSKYHTLVVPSLCILEKEQIESLKSFVTSGGHLILCDAFPDKPLPIEYAEFFGLEHYGDPYNCAYAVSGLSQRSVIPTAIQLNHDLRRVTAPGDAEIIYYNSPTPGGGNWVPEVYPLLEKGDMPFLFSLYRDQGRISYFTGSFGKMMWENDLPDYRDILDYLLFAELKSKRILETDAPETVQITAYHSGTYTVIHLVNGTGSIPLDIPIPVGPIHIKLNNIKADNG